MSTSKRKKERRSKLKSNPSEVPPNPSEDLAVKHFTIKHQFKFSEKHQNFLDLCLNEKSRMIFVDGVAGTGKSYLAVMAAITKIKEGKTNQLIYIRSLVESASRSMGFLPGTEGDKFAPWSMPLMDKLNEMLHPMVTKKLLDEEKIKCVPVNFCRGLTFHDSVVIVDESQNCSGAELRTILTRFGKNSTYVVIGDTKQSDIDRSGFADIFNRFNDEESVEKGIHTIKFGNTEIVRSEILKFIVKKLDC